MPSGKDGAWLDAIDGPYRFKAAPLPRTGIRQAEKLLDASFSRKQEHCLLSDGEPTYRLPY